MSRLSLVIGFSVMTLVLLAGCSFGKNDLAAVSSDGKAVVKDAIDGDLDQAWSCSSLRLAAARVPHDIVVSRPVAAINEATGDACNDALDDVKVGQTRKGIASLLGAPSGTQSGCVLFSWLPSKDSSIDGARICFSDDQVATVGIATHG